MAVRFLSATEYETCLRFALRKLGLDDAQIDRLLASRWPTDTTGLIAEAAGRGLILGKSDIMAALYELTDDPDLRDELQRRAERDDPRLLFGPKLADLILEWCAENDRAEPTPVGAAMARFPRFTRAMLDHFQEDNAAPGN